MSEKQLSNRSSDWAEHKLIKEIIKGDFPPGSTLPPERDLAARLGVARPTLREALQRLERDEWVRIRKGQPTVVNDFWKYGNLNTLANIVLHTDQPSENFVVHLLEVRAALAPAFVRGAVAHSPAKVVAVLANSCELEDNPGCYTAYDWRLQKVLAGLSGNPIYLLILNSFDAIYDLMGKLYFARKENRRATRLFYERLLAAAMSSDAGKAEILTREAMIESIVLWKKHQADNA